ncbi:MAG: hypothetical protein ACXVGK_11705, partial [Mycobacteriaceae bacterium]
PEPWATVFTEHRESLRQLVDEVETATGTNRALLVAGASSVRETLLSLTQAVDIHDSHGVSAGHARQPILMNEQG